MEGIDIQVAAERMEGIHPMEDTEVFFKADPKDKAVEISFNLDFSGMGEDDVLFLRMNARKLRAALRVLEGMEVLHGSRNT